MTSQELIELIREIAESEDDIITSLHPEQQEAFCDFSESLMRALETMKDTKQYSCNEWETYVFWLGMSLGMKLNFNNEYLERRLIYPINI